MVVVRGGGDLGTGVVHRLFRAGYKVLILEAETPSVVRRTVAFAQAVFDGTAVVEGVEARVLRMDEAEGVARRESAPGWIPLVVDPKGKLLSALQPRAVVDARMAKRNLGTSRDDAEVTIGLGPGFTAGEDVDYVVETKRGHTLGRLILEGRAEPDTGVPGVVAGVGADRLLRSPAAGRFRSHASIGDTVSEGEVVGDVGGARVEARTAGLLRGLVNDGTEVREGQKIGDVDPRGAEIDHTLISDKARSVGGAVLEGLLASGILPEAHVRGSHGDV